MTDTDTGPEAPEAPVPAAPEAANAAAIAGATVAPADIVAAAPAAEVEGKDWTKGALIMVGKHPIAKDEKRPIIVVEEWSDPIIGEDGYTKRGDEAKVTTEGYPAKADLYFRTDDSVVFPDKAPVMQLGLDVQQLQLHGFSPDVRTVCVGPAQPAYAAANVAYQRGARDIEIKGLSDNQKAALQPYIDRLPVDPNLPAEDVTITLT